MQEPYRTMYFSLLENGWTAWGQWRYHVKATDGAIYIGSNDTHITVLRDQDGYHKTVGHMGRGQRGSLTVEAVIADLLSPGQRWDTTADMLTALEWFRTHPSRM